MLKKRKRKLGKNTRKLYLGNKINSATSAMTALMSFSAFFILLKVPIISTGLVVD